MEEKLKTQVVQAAEAVKRKAKELRMTESNNERMLETVFEPITKPLRQIIHKNNYFKTTNEAEDEIIGDTLNEIVDKHPPREYRDIIIKNKPCSSRDNISDDDDDFEDDNSEDDSKTDLSNISFKTIESMSSPCGDDSSWSLSSEVLSDVPYGVRIERGKLMIGSARANIREDKISIGGNDYVKTDGLCELLLKKVPNMELVTERDLQAYKRILVETNAHRRDYDSNKPIKANRGQKYLHIIKPLFKLRKLSTSSASSAVSTKEHMSEGAGLTLNKQFKRNTDYIYWDDPNELVERLKLLIASKDAGNTGLDSEIISIIEELRENKIIN